MDLLRYLLFRSRSYFLHDLTFTANHISYIFQKVVTKRKVKLSKRFKCPFCANDDVVECSMDYKAGIGSLSCRLCGASYQMTIHHLNEPIDVHSEWLDDCEAAAMNNNTASRSNGGATNAAAGYDDDDDDDGALPSASGLQQQRSKKPQSIKNDRNNPSIDLGVGDSEEDDDDDE